MKEYQAIISGFRKDAPAPVPLSKYDVLIGNLFQSIFVLFQPEDMFFLLQNPRGIVVAASPDAEELIGLSMIGNQLSDSLGSMGFREASMSFSGEYPFTIKSYGTAEDQVLQTVCKQIGRSLVPLSDAQLKYMKKIDFVFKAFDAIEDYAITVIDENAIIQFANKTNADILKIDNSLMQDFIEKEMDILDKASSILYRVLKTGEKENKKDHVYMLEGKPIHQQNTAYPIVNEDGKIIGSVDIFTSADSKKILSRSNPPAQTFSLTAAPPLIGDSPAMTRLLEVASGYADYPHCVLILGESGTGKEMIAQYIHKRGARSEMPFVTLNCANLMDTLIDSELFGYDEGAYTGSAKGGKKGKFQLAHRGTLFLDEIGELPLHLQAKLLRAIETKRISRLGSEDTINVDVRIIAATNRPLAQMVKEGSFREDLFYRLNVLNLDIPPLRERKEDIPLLVGHFMEKYHVESARRNAMTELVNSEIQNYLSDYEWPGNIRELENLIIRFIVLSGKNNTHIIDLLGYANRSDDSGGNEIPKRRETYISKEELTRIMNQCKGNKREASRLLGVGRSTLYRYLAKYGM